VIMHVPCVELFLAQAAQPAGERTNPLQALLGFAPVILILIAFFWFTHRSQKRRDQERQQMLDSVRPKDRVVTMGGVHGRVVSVKDDTFVLRVDDEKDVKITINRTGISRKADDQAGEGQMP